MTPAIRLAKQLKINYQIHQYEHDPNVESYGLEASEKLGIACEKVFKTLVVSDEKNQLAVAIIPVDKRLNLKKMAKVIGSKKATMAEQKIVERTTGYVLGGVSPLGQKKRLPTVIHQSGENQATILVSAGKRGLDIELAPSDLAEILSAKFADIIQD